ncbi:MAG: DUF4142 domain-containing protein [Gemmatimonadota bacterium]|nr:DUF4142 domain-containing protein [Gemmatimonadota bacterium]
MNRTRITAAIVQAEVAPNLEEGLALTANLAREAANSGAELIVFPETWLPGYPAWLDVCRDAALWNHAPVKAIFARLHWVRLLRTLPPLGRAAGNRAAHPEQHRLRQRHSPRPPYRPGNAPPSSRWQHTEPRQGTRMSIQSTHASATGTVARSDVDEAISTWPARPRLAVQQMMAQYGPPLEVSTEAVIWHHAGLFKRIMVTKKEVPHDFPKPHMDFLEHTVSYRVPAEKVEELVAFDASMTINATAGEMSARCDLEGHNVLTLNLARDIIEGKKTVKQARAAFAEHVVEDVGGLHPAYVEELQFVPRAAGAAFPDEPNIPGSPVRGTHDATAAGTDGEVLAFLIAMDDNVVLAATAAHKKKLGGDVAKLAQSLHEAHGKSQAKTMALGMKIKTTPVDTEAVDDLRVKGAGELATLVPLNGAEFERGYVAAMAKGHAEALEMIDGQLLPVAKDKDLVKHLTKVREDVAGHLKELQSAR